MGFALAEAFAGKGALVTLITGPVSQIADNKNIQRIDVVSADEMYSQCTQSFKTADIVIMAAAVADYRSAAPAGQKIKKKSGSLILELQPNKDILSELGRNKQAGQFLCGFALETENEHSNALQKLSNKNLDMIVLNSLKDEGAGFGYDTNKVTILAADKTEISLPLLSKRETAEEIIAFIYSKINFQPKNQ
jgi:phosphopantothenoylcysteine decarboxylase/phosphopantothenate--cysteine ligase